MFKNIVSFDIGIRNLAYCVIETVQTTVETTESSDKRGTFSIKDWDVISLCEKSEKVKDVPLQVLCKRMGEKLESIPKLLQVDCVVLENQPSYINPKMKSIQMMLFTFFVHRGIKDVMMFAPRQKLNVYKGPPVECHLKSKYARTKFLGISYCRYMIQHLPLLGFFNQHKKKDDLADSLLQGILFLMKKNKYSCYELI